MSEAEISLLIGDIYDAALEPARWPQALGRLCGFVGGSQAQIFWQDVVDKYAQTEARVTGTARLGRAAVGSA